MKHFFLFICCIIVLMAMLASQTFATSTPTGTKKPTITDSNTTQKLSEQINSLKDRIASRVAELQLVEKRGVIGTVTETSNSQMTITDIENQAVIIDVDEITKFASPNKKNDFGISDIDEGTKISVLGNYNKQSRRILARFVDEVTIPAYVNGMVANVDTDSGTVTVATEDNKQITVDIETVTKTTSYTDDTPEKSGLSDIEVGIRVMVQGYPDKTRRDRVVATRVLLFPGLPKNPKIIIPDKALLEDDEIVPSTGSGKKITPIR